MPPKGRVVCLCTSCIKISEWRNGVLQPGKTVGYSTRSEHQRHDADAQRLAAAGFDDTEQVPQVQEHQPALNQESFDFRNGEHLILFGEDIENNGTLEFYCP